MFLYYFRFPDNNDFIMKRILFLLCIISSLIFCPYSGYSQKEQKPPLSERLFFGGNFSLQFGTVTFIELSPSIGYKLTKKLSMAGGPIYMYYNDKSYTPDFNTNIFGSHVYSRLLLFEPSEETAPLNFGGSLFAQVEYEWLSMENKLRFGYNANGRFDLHSIYVGGGLQFPLGVRANIFVMLLYNLNDSPYSIYSNPIIRMGFNF